MKLDATDLRYITADEFRVLTAVSSSYNTLLGLVWPSFNIEKVTHSLHIITLPIRSSKALVTTTQFPPL